MTEKDSAKGEEREHLDPNVPQKKNVKWNELLLSRHHEKMNHVSPSSLVEVMIPIAKKAKKIANDTHSGLIDDRTQTAAGVVKATKEMEPNIIESERKAIAKMCDEKAEAFKQTIEFLVENGQLGPNADPEKCKKALQYLNMKFGEDHKSMRVFYKHLQVYDDITPGIGKDGLPTDERFKQRLHALARGEEVSILVEGEEKTVTVNWPANMMGEEMYDARIRILLAMWQSRRALLNLLGAETLLVLHIENPGRYGDTFHASHDEQHQVSLVEDFIAETAPHNTELQDLMSDRSVVERQVILFGPGVSIRDLKTLEGARVSQDEVVHIVKTLLALPPEAREMIADFSKKVPAVLPALLLSPTLKWDGNSVSGDIRNWFVRLTRDMEMYVRIPKQREERVDFRGKKVAQAIEEGLILGTNKALAGETNYFNREAERLKKLVKALSNSDVDLTDTQVIERDLLARWVQIVEIIREGRRGADDRSALMRINILNSGDTLNMEVAYALGAFMEICNARGYRPSFDDLVAFTHKWDEGSHRAPVAFEQFSETRDIGGDLPPTVTV